MQLIIKKSFIIVIFTFFLIIPNKSYSTSKILTDNGIITIMYHRFDENKYPSTNIKIADFKEHINLIKSNNFIFVNPKNFEEKLRNEKDKKKDINYY